MIVAGFGFRTGASEASLRDALARAAQDLHPTHLATLDDKTQSLQALLRGMDLPVIGVGAKLATAQTTLTQSAASQAARKTGSVAEACALAAAGPNARLLAPRAISVDRMATCALAEPRTP